MTSKIRKVAKHGTIVANCRIQYICNIEYNAQLKNTVPILIVVWSLVFNSSASILLINYNYNSPPSNNSAPLNNSDTIN